MKSRNKLLWGWTEVPFHVKASVKIANIICRRRNENDDSEITRICENTGFKQVSTCTIMYLVDFESCQNTIHFMLQRF